MLKPRFSTDFVKDLASIQEFSREEYDNDGVIRYTMLIDATIRCLATEGMPHFSVKAHKDGYFSYHLKNLKKQVRYKGIQIKKHLIRFSLKSRKTGFT